MQAPFEDERSSWKSGFSARLDPPESAALFEAQGAQLLHVPADRREPEFEPVNRLWIPFGESEFDPREVNWSRPKAYDASGGQLGEAGVQALVDLRRGANEGSRVGTLCLEWPLQQPQRAYRE